MSSFATGEVVSYSGGTWVYRDDYVFFERCDGANFLILEIDLPAIFQGEKQSYYVWALHLDKKEKMLIGVGGISEFSPGCLAR